MDCMVRASTRGDVAGGRYPGKALRVRRSNGLARWRNTAIGAVTRGGFSPLGQRIRLVASQSGKA